MRTSPGKPIAGLGVLAVTAIAFGAAVLAGIGVWYILYRQAADLRTRLSATQAEVETLTAQLDEAKAKLAERAEDGPPVVVTAPADAPGEQPSGSERQFCYVTDVTESGSSYSVVLDFAQLLTGRDAADAAAAHGEESPPPNDYYILNDNPKLRTFKADASTRVILYEGGVTDKRSLTLAQFAKVFTANQDGKADVPYYAVISDGTVLSLEEQYLP